MVLNKLFLVCFLAGLGNNLQAYPTADIEPNDDNFIQSLSGNTEIQKLFELYLNNTERAVITANVNDVADILLQELNRYVIANKLDSIDMPGFLVNVLVAKIGFKEGKFRGIGSIIRRGDITLDYEFPNLVVKTDAGIEKIGFVYKYEATFLGIGPRGSMEGHAQGSRFRAEVQFDLTTLRWKTSTFTLQTIGKVTFEFKEGIFDGIINMLTRPIVDLLTPIIKNVVKGVIGGTLNIVMDMYNKAICGFLGSCTL